METIVKINWDEPKSQSWLCAENIQIALESYCKNTRFNVEEFTADSLYPINISVDIPDSLLEDWGSSMSKLYDEETTVVIPDKHVTNKVFLGGTCKNTTWRDELIPMLNIYYHIPTFLATDNLEKDVYCNIHLYVITSKMKNYPIAEVMESVQTEGKKTILQIVPEGFDGGEIRILVTLAKVLEGKGGLSILSNNFNTLGNLLNLIS